MFYENFNQPILLKGGVLKRHYDSDKTPVFLTYKNYSKVLHLCETRKLLDPNRPIVFSDDCKGKKEEEKAICLCLTQLQRENPQEYEKLINFNCYGDEAKDNLFALLNEFGSVCFKKKTMFSSGEFGFRKAQGTKTYSVEEFLGDSLDARFPFGKRYYLCYTNQKQQSGMEIYIDSDMVDSLHGNLCCFVVFFKTGMVLRGNRGHISIYFDAPIREEKLSESESRENISDRGKISFYNRDGTLENQQELTRENIKNTLGMMIRCTLNTGAIVEGFSDPLRQYEKDKFDGFVHEFIHLWTWEHLDEESHKLTGNGNTKYDQIFTPVAVNDIIRIDAILHSNPRWGGMLTNRFFVDTENCDKRRRHIEEIRQAFVDGGRKRATDPEYRQKSDEIHECFKKHLYGYGDDI